MTQMPVPHLVLFGYRGSGKSTTGRLLADALSWPFIDTDQRIVEAYDGMSIREIWDKHGEAHFRDTECRICCEILKEAPSVIALGGGAIIQDLVHQSYEQAASDGIIIRFYLQAQAEVLNLRIHGDHHTAEQRPAMSALGGSLAEIHQILNQRSPRYNAAADHIIEVDHLPPEAVTQAILDYRSFS